jgi:LysM repeat protein
VQSGDTLSTIATQYGVTMEQLASENNISDVNHVVVGTTLKVPTR